MSARRRVGERIPPGEAWARPCRCDPNPFQCGPSCGCMGCGCLKERPVLFTGGNVIEIGADRKTQTRRIVKPFAHPVEGAQWCDCLCGEIDPSDQPCVRCREIACGRSPYGTPGDRLWVRETWAAGKGYDADPAQKLRRAKVSDMHMGINIWYRADDSGPTSWNQISDPPRLETGKANPNARGEWRPSIFMPRWASRLQLEVTGVRVERLNSISEADAIAEGVMKDRGIGCAGWWRDYLNADCALPSAVDSYASLWESINGRGSWKLNPWVWCITFKRIEVTCG